jgi:hypothetical protein
MARKTLIWISSFPKSGNTWVRILLQLFESAERGRGEELDLNSLSVGQHSAARSLIERFSPFVASELALKDLDRARFAALRRLSDTALGEVFLKVHDRFRMVDEDCLFGPDISAACIYILRNPLDVTVSLANHEKCEYEEAVKMLNSGFYIARDTLKLHRQLPQDVGSWAEHAASWIDQSKIPVVVVRYEDLIEDAVGELARILAFIGRDASRVELEAIVDAARFERLKATERKRGFREKPAGMTAFFRSGTVGEGHAKLSGRLAARIMEANRSMMARVGYSTELEKSKKGVDEYDV